MNDQPQDTPNPLLPLADADSLAWVWVDYESRDPTQSGILDAWGLTLDSTPAEIAQAVERVHADMRDAGFSPIGDLHAEFQRVIDASRASGIDAANDYGLEAGANYVSRLVDYGDFQLLIPELPEGLRWRDVIERNERNAIPDLLEEAGVPTDEDTSPFATELRRIYWDAFDVGAVKEAEQYAGMPRNSDPE